MQSVFSITLPRVYVANIQMPFYSHKRKHTHESTSLFIILVLHTNITTCHSSEAEIIEMFREIYTVHLQYKLFLPLATPVSVCVLKQFQ